MVLVVGARALLGAVSDLPRACRRECYCYDGGGVFSKEKMNVRKFRNDTWCFNVHLVWPVNSIQFRDYVRRALCNPDYKDPGAFTAMCHASPKDVVIGFKSWAGGDEDLGNLVHELFHAVHYQLDYVGLKLSGETDEVYAYLQNSLFDKCVPLLPRKRRK